MCARASRTEQFATFQSRPRLAVTVAGPRRAARIITSSVSATRAAGTSSARVWAVLNNNQLVLDWLNRQLRRGLAIEDPVHVLRRERL
jgi:hypothetical protein